MADGWLSRIAPAAAALCLVLSLGACGLDWPVRSTAGPAGGPAPAPTLEGEVTTADGRPIAGVLVTPQSTDVPPQAVPELASITDEQGRYQWMLQPGTYTITFTHDGYRERTDAVVVRSDQLTRLNVVLERT